MTTEIPKDDWKESMDGLSRDLEDWETHIEVFSNDVGAQVVADGLPFHGLTVEDCAEGKLVIQLLLGNCTESHLTHTIVDPVKIAFEGTGLGPSGVLYIEDASGTKTLVKFVQPFPVLLEYVNTDIVNSVASSSE